MQTHLKTIVIRHKKENLKKCSLRNLEKREDIEFIQYPFETLPSLKGYIMLVMEEAPILTQEDAACGLLLLDSTWRYLPKMIQAVELQEKVEKRVLPSGFRTAYPRNQQDCIDPTRGLSSLEAFFITYHILGRPTDGLLDHYFWKEKFLQLNIW